MKTIIFYNLDGTIKCEMKLTIENVRIAGGMLVRCTMKDGAERVGYLGTDEENKFIYLWTWKNIDEEEHTLIGNESTKYEQESYKIDFEKIEKVEAKLYSNPRWGGIITNKFE